MTTVAGHRMRKSPHHQLHPFSRKVVEVVNAIPSGKVLTYSGVARLAGNPQGARQVGRLLHSLSGRFQLPWQRVVGAGGRITLRDLRGRSRQAALLHGEGVEFDGYGRIDLGEFSWEPGDSMK